MLPTLFLSHGSPMHALDAGAAGEVWTALAESLPTPSAVLMVTAHWETNLPMLSGNPRPSMIYDFGGFPDALYRIKYAAPGAPDVAKRAVALLKTVGITAAAFFLLSMHEHGMIATILMWMLFAAASIVFFLFGGAGIWAELNYGEKRNG